MPTMSEADFIEQLAERLDAPAGSAAGTPAPTPTTTTPPADPASGATPTAEHQASDGSPAAPDATEHDTDADEQDPATGADADPASDDADAGSGEDADDPEGVAAGEQDDDDAADEADDPANAAIAADVRDRLEKAGLKTSLKDLPPEARVLVQRKLDHAQAAVTRALQEATAFRKERAEFLAEKQLFAEHPEMMIAALLEQGGDGLAEKVNAIIEKFTDPDKKRLFETDLKDARAKAMDAVTTIDRRNDQMLQRADEIESYVRRACGKLGLPVDVVEQAIALELLQKPEDARDLDDQELDTIITRQHRILRGHTQRRNLAERQERIRERTRDKQTTTPAVRMGSGVTNPVPTGKKPPKTDDEFAAMMEAKL